MNKKLFDAIALNIENFKLKDLRAISKKLTQSYKTRKNIRFSNIEERLAYIIARMPATYSAIKFVLNDLKEIYDLKIKSVLDLGAGPLTSFWSFLSIYPDIKEFTFLERDTEILDIGKKLISNLDHLNEKKIIYRNENILKLKEYSSDTVILSYVINEMKNYEIEKIINNFIKSKKAKNIIFIEPGTRYGFKNILNVRNILIKKELNILSPCPNNLKCPMKKNDWCHFYVRLSRSKSHKYLKQGKLGFEDEKFSYLVATKQKIKNEVHSRVLRFVKKSREDLTVTLCSDGEEKKIKILKHETKEYKKAKKLDWGDTYV